MDISEVQRRTLRERGRHKDIGKGENKTGNSPRLATIEVVHIGRREEPVCARLGRRSWGALDCGGYEFGRHEDKPRFWKCNVCLLVRDS